VNRITAYATSTWNAASQFFLKSNYRISHRPQRFILLLQPLTVIARPRTRNRDDVRFCPIGFYADAAGYF
jgi:hypothetical protein